MNPKSAQFARDEFGDAYWREFATNESLGRRHECSFVVLASTREDADALADKIGAAGAKVEVSDYCGSEQYPWQITVRMSLPASTLAIDEFHDRLRQLALMRGGRLVDSGMLEPTQDAGPLV